MTWNDKHVNEVRYPDHPDLEQALNNFRQQFTWYEQQLKHRKKGVDTAPVECSWNNFLKLRNKYFGYHRRSPDQTAVQGHGTGGTIFTRADQPSFN